VHLVEASTHVSQGKVHFSQDPELLSAK